MALCALLAPVHASCSCPSNLESGSSSSHQISNIPSHYGDPTTWLWKCCIVKWENSDWKNWITINTVYWYLMMQTSVHITYYVLHLDVSSSNKSCSSSVILLLLLLFHKHIQRNTIPQWHSLVADTTLRWSVHLCIFRTLISLAVVCASAICSVTDMQLLTERSQSFDYELGRSTTTVNMKYGLSQHITCVELALPRPTNIFWSCRDV